MPSVLSLLDLLPNGGGDGKAFEFLTVDNMRRFNEETPDVPGVKYFSWGAVYEPGLIDTWKLVLSLAPASSSDMSCCRWSHSVILEKEGPNDGLVSLQSARWVRTVMSLMLCYMLTCPPGHISWHARRREPS